MRNLLPLRRSARRFAADERGSALVEFSLVFPVMLVFFAFVVLFGHMLWSYQKAVEGVRDASRYLARVAPIDICKTAGNLNGWTGTVTGIVRNDAGGASLFPTLVTINSVTPTHSCTTGLYRTAPAPVVTVTASITIALPMAGVFTFFGPVPTSVTTTIVGQSRIFGA